MSIPVIILGDPGTGKSYSLRNFAGDDVAIVQSLPKLLPFHANVKVTSTMKKTGNDAIDALSGMEKIRNWLDGALAEHKVVVLDDFGYEITDIYVEDSLDSSTAKKDQYEVYKKIAALTYKLIRDCMIDEHDDRIIYIVMHEERDSFGNIEPATVGKLLNEKLKLIGTTTIMLHAVVDSTGYRFVTNLPPFKSPPGMFEQEIENDLEFVDATIRDYYQMKPRKKEAKK